MRLSVIIITLNEAKNIEACLDSVRFADERIVLDGGSTDDTAELARRLGAAVHASSDWPGFGPQKNRALSLATGDWVFSLDADERVPPALAAEILRVVESSSGADAWQCPRLSNYCGQAIWHAGWYPDRVTRLFRRGKARFSDDMVHERVVFEGQLGQLKTALLHDSFPNFESVLNKIDRYSSASAQALYAKGKQASLATALGHGLWAFFRTYVLKRGFLDGQMGLALAISNAQGSYYRYAKLWLMHRRMR